jgi:hypothetical protein
MEWSLAPAQALTTVKAWQAWAPEAPEAMTSTLTIAPDPNRRIWIECAGQSVGSEDQLRRELRGLLKLNRTHADPTIKPLSFLEAVDYFSEGWSYQSVLYKGKSDILSAPLSDDGIAVLFEGMQNLPEDEFNVVFCAYGGCPLLAPNGHSARRSGCPLDPKRTPPLRKLAD